jgi:hypothetical protein
MDIVGEKLGMNPRIGRPVSCGLGGELFFSRAVDPFTKGCHVWGLHVGTIRVVYMD